MKKSNLITVLFLSLAVIAVIIFAVFKGTAEKKTDNPNSEISSDITSSALDTDSKADTPNISQPESSTDTTSSKVPSESTVSSVTSVPDSSVVSSTVTSSENVKIPVNGNNSLFIGDSRTVGIMEYANIKNADFYCNTGMSVFNIQKGRVSVPNVGKVTLEELLNNKKYDKIYVMLGINEIGYNFDTLINKYSELLNFIEKRQPNSVIFIEANLHVTKKRSDTDKIINNTAIDSLNARLEKLSDGKKIFYLDANTVFDDKNNALDAEKTQDSVHLYAKYYAEWGKWIADESAKYVTVKD